MTWSRSSSRARKKRSAELQTHSPSQNLHSKPPSTRCNSTTSAKYPLNHWSNGDTDSCRTFRFIRFSFFGNEFEQAFQMKFFIFPDTLIFQYYSKSSFQHQKLRADSAFILPFTQKLVSKLHRIISLFSLGQIRVSDCGIKHRGRDLISFASSR